MTSWNMLQLIRSAAELARLINRLTENFPPEEQYVMVPMLRDTALTVLEYAALGMARYDIPDRCMLLSRALVSLNELSSHFILCKTIGVMSPSTYQEILDSADLLRSQLMAALKSVGHPEAGDLPLL